MFHLVIISIFTLLNVERSVKLLTPGAFRQKRIIWTFSAWISFHQYHVLRMQGDVQKSKFEFLGDVGSNVFRLFGFFLIFCAFPFSPFLIFLLQ